ncbi:ATP-binding protein [Colwellia sp. BRX10-3]|uniref:protein DpdH n=1 Tax=Colwellia sp. BRX10-3 TaxID=2759844 RepID=UPI0015F56B0C|nr:protein DpdH [Colwellia sp. BRX10-3]MBA6390468.1 ATP-binding protein [Colwellia sp. BRX10-3]
MSVLENYWPQKSRVEECIMTEAESLSDSLLMAVHEPMRLLKRHHQTGEEMRADEQALFDFFLEHNRPIPITGSAGVGKSHIIRWLGAQLERQPDADKYHTIYIPKSSSIADVVRLLTEGLKGEVYDEIRRSVDGISQEIKVSHIAEHLALKLRLCLDEELQKLQSKLDVNYQPKPEETQFFECLFTHASGLQALLQDSHLTKHFTREGACLYNIAERLYLGVKDTEGFEQDYQMYAEDFEIQSEVAAAAIDAQMYIQNSQLLTDPNSRNNAAWTLNQVLYTACGKTAEELLKINPMTIQKVVRSIRQQLFADNKANELVILIEDFTTTTAIQKEFIECLMEEEQHHGTQTLCRLKSVIAVTEGFAGYLHVRDGILGRTGYEWLIESVNQNESETLDRIIDFCGRYLNAARYGNRKLADMFKKAGNEHKWITVWHDTEVTESEYRPRLDAFGYTHQEYPLFPYNRLALEQLARKHCISHGQLQFHPRSILHYLLRQPLKLGRESYLANTFPPAKWQNFICNTAVGSQFSILSEPERAKTLAAVWGGNPTSIQRLSNVLPLEVCDEFNLSDMDQVLDISAVKPHPVAPRGNNLETSNVHNVAVTTTQINNPGNKPTSPSVVNDPDIPTEPKEILEWREKLDAWHQGSSTLKQPDAAKLRRWIAEGLDTSIDWGHYLCRSQKINFSKIHLPVKVGNVASPVLDLSNADAFKQNGDQWIPAFNAMAAYHHYNKTWVFEGGDVAYLHYQNFFEEVIPKVTEHLVSQERKLLSSIAHKLLQGASFIGAEGANARSGRKRLDAILFTTQEKRQYKLLGDLDAQWDLVSSRRKELRDELVRLVAVRKPGAEPYAIDGPLVIDALKQPPVKEPDVLDKVLRDAPKLRSQIFPTIELLRELFEGDKDAVEAASEQIQETLSLAIHTDVVHPTEIASKLRTSLKAWSKESRTKLVKDLSNLQLSDDKENEARLLQDIVSVDAEQYEVAYQLFNDFELFEKRTSALLITKIRTQGGEEIEQAQQDVFNQLDMIEQQLEELN